MLVKITTVDNIKHIVDPEKLDEIGPNTRAALKTAYDAGNWEPYTPPEPEPLPPEPNPKGFKVTLMADPLFLQWQEDIPAIRREDLKLAAIADNWPLAQLLYDQLKAMILTPEGATAQWQSIADAHAIPLVF